MRFYSFLLILLSFFLCFHEGQLLAQNTARDFDFWIGEWDVNLRVRQDDLSWKDQHQSVARIYSILGGRAILELWQETSRPDGIIGYSIRYLDKASGEWIIWLNWPGEDRSGSTSLKGNFRHGRGEFFQEWQVNDSTTRISRYTFSDISKDAFRWDDAYSTDGGKNWSANWIMEFSRRKEKAPPLAVGELEHTNLGAYRCNLEGFTFLQTLDANPKHKQIKLFKVLDGCATMMLRTHKKREEFSFLSYNTYIQQYEMLVLGDDPDVGAELFYGPLVDGKLELVHQKDGKPMKKRVLWQDQEVNIQDYRYKGEAWIATEKE